MKHTPTPKQKRKLELAALRQNLADIRRISAELLEARQGAIERSNRWEAA